MKKFAAAAILGALASAFSLYAYAQDSARPVDSTAGERLQAALKARAMTRPRVSPPPIGQPAPETVESKIDWIGMRTELALTQRREIAGQQGSRTFQTRTPGLRAAPPDRFKTVSTREVNVARLPVLAPEGSLIPGSLKVYSLGDSYSATGEIEDGVSMRMSGSRKKIVVGDLKSARTRIATIRKQSATLPSVNAPYYITRSEGSTDLTFAKFGAGYVLSIVCDDDADARCAEDAFITNLASNLLLLNPEAERE